MFNETTLKRPPELESQWSL